MTAIVHDAARPAAATRPVALWLLACAAMVFLMAVIGAVTRLTESGLSIVEWEPLVGAVPPLTEAEWQRVFGLYQATPEYIHKNAWMTLDDFKRIFFWEWLHRLWGRLIGVAFLVPFLVFWVRGRLDRSMAPKLLGLFVLGGLQGALGWYMVMSGLVDRPSVSHYRLAAHLGLAVLIYALLLWTALSLLRPSPEGAAPARLRGHVWGAMALAAVTVVWGAFVAGLDAGMAYNSFPTMNGEWAPAELWVLSPLWANFVENAAAVQFAHRWLGIATAAVVLALSARALRLPPSAGRTAALLAGGMALLQVGLGIATLVLQVPIALAAAHQAGALVLIGLLTWTAWEARRA